MKTIHAMAVLAALAAGPALAQEYPPSGRSGGASTSTIVVEPRTLARIQQQLRQDGFYRGPVDGIYGPETRRALSQWQTENGLPATGQLDRRTLAQMDVDVQQAETPSEDDQPSGTVETLRNERMSSPNVEGENVPEDPQTGLPRPGRDPDQLESTPRP